MGCPRLRGWTPLVESSNLILWNFFSFGGDGEWEFLFSFKKISFSFGVLMRCRKDGDDSQIPIQNLISGMD
jgi:hypothetical protein